MDKIYKILADIQKQINDLRNTRSRQMDLLPGVVTNKSMGEPNSYIYAGLSTNLPTEGVQLSSTGVGCSIYWAYDTNTLYIWNGSAWVSTTLS